MLGPRTVPSIKKARKEDTALEKRVAQLEQLVIGLTNENHALGKRVHEVIEENAALKQRRVDGEEVHALKQSKMQVESQLSQVINNNAALQSRIVTLETTNASLQQMVNTIRDTSNDLIDNGNVFRRVLGVHHKALGRPDVPAIP
jgi:chromosome segregation ATPase